MFDCKSIVFLVCTYLLFVYILCLLIACALELHMLAMVPLKPPIMLQIPVFFSTPRSPLPIVNFKPINVKTLNMSPNNNPPKNLSKGKHKASDNVVLEVNSR